MTRWIPLGLCAVLLVSGCSPSSAQLRKQAIAEFQIGNYPQAKDYFEQVLAREPSDPEILYYMGRIEHEKGFYEQAEYYFRCCIDAAPGYRDAYAWLTRTQARKSFDSSQTQPATP